MKKLFFIIALAFVSFITSAQIFVKDNVVDLQIFIDDSNAQYIIDAEKQSAQLIVKELQGSSDMSLMNIELVIQKQEGIPTGFILSLATLVAEIEAMKPYSTEGFDKACENFLQNFE